MTHLIIKPNYVSLFSCTGPACEDSCCNDWGIYFDKKSYKNTLTDPRFASLAKIALVEVKTSKAHWARIKLDDHGACPFLDAEKLCQIHKQAGEQALSHTCKTYPRTSSFIGGNKFESMSMSCPEVARILLFHPEAFHFDAQASGHKTPTKASPIWLEKSYDYSLELLIGSQLDWEQALLAIGLLIKTSESVRLHQMPVTELDTRFQQLQQFAKAGLLTEQYRQLAYSDAPQSALFVAMHNELCQIHSRGERPRFTELNLAINQACNEENGYSLATMNRAWNDIALPALADYPDLFDRYILYYLFHTHFPAPDSQDPGKSYRLLVLDCFIIRCYLSAMALKNNGLTQGDIILCFQVYQVVRQHRSVFADRIEGIMQACGLDSVPAAISLLKTKA
jgi:lysine-N-methylase